jgi:MYND finger
VIIIIILLINAQFLLSQDGYGVKRSVTSGRRLLLLAASFELGYHLAPPTEEHVHVANKFLCEWFTTQMDTLEEKGLRLCSHEQCGRVETRLHEFRRCSVCGVVNYCSRSCQALHWRKGHKTECMPIEQFLDNAVFAVPG